ncbi:MAG: hypothetical protein EOM68_02400, partial [Spirochaetia bacterium]|nr:hypothetical protein [Spirochaetia bacterium]
MTNSPIRKISTTKLKLWSAAVGLTATEVKRPFGFLIFCSIIRLLKKWVAAEAFGIGLEDIHFSEPPTSVIGDGGSTAATRGTMVGGGAILGALLSMSVVLAAARHVRDGAGLLVFGVMFGFAVSALVSVLLSWALPDQVQRYVAWGFGSFASSGWDRVRGLGVVM